MKRLFKKRSLHNSCSPSIQISNSPPQLVGKNWPEYLIYNWPLNNMRIRGTKHLHSQKSTCNFDSTKTQLLISCWPEALPIIKSQLTHILYMFLYTLFLQQSKLEKCFSNCCRKFFQYLNWKKSPNKWTCEILNCVAHRSTIYTSKHEYHYFPHLHLIQVHHAFDYLIYFDIFFHVSI